MRTSYSFGGVCLEVDAVTRHVCGDQWRSYLADEVSVHLAHVFDGDALNVS